MKHRDESFTGFWLMKTEKLFRVCNLGKSIKQVNFTLPF